MQVGNLLGGLLLLLLLSCSFFTSFCCCGFFFFLLLLLLLLLVHCTNHEQVDHRLGKDVLVVVEIELAIDVINLILGHFLAKVHEDVGELLPVDDVPCHHLSLDLLLHLHIERLEGIHHELVRVVHAASHLCLEHLDHVVVVAGPPTSDNMLFSSSSMTSLPTLSKAALRSVLLITPSLSMSMSLKHSLYVSRVASSKPLESAPFPSPLPIAVQSSP